MRPGGRSLAYASGLVFRRPITRSPAFHCPRFLRSSTRSNRFSTLRLELFPPAERRLGCCDIKCVVNCWTPPDPEEWRTELLARSAGGRHWFLGKNGVSRAGSSVRANGLWVRLALGMLPCHAELARFWLSRHRMRVQSICRQEKTCHR